MKFIKVLIKPYLDYGGRIYRYTNGKRYPDADYLFETTLHWHFAYELIFIKRGSMNINKLNESIELKENDVYILNSQEVHSYTVNSTDSDIIIINSMPRDLMKKFIYSKDKKPVTFSISEGEAKEQIIKSLISLSEYKNYDDPLDSIRIKALLYNISYYILRDCVDDTIVYTMGSEAKEFDCAKTAIFYIVNNYKRDITLGEISKYVGMAPTHFSKYFKEKTSATFSKFLQKVRLENALNDMNYNDSTVKAAAENNGFPNVNSFINACKNEYGKTPAEMKPVQQKSSDE